MQFACFPEYLPRMFCVQDDFPGTFAESTFRDGFRYNFRDIPQTRFSVTFPGRVSGDVSSYVVFESVSRDVLRGRVSCSVSGTFSYTSPWRRFAGAVFFRRALGHFHIRFRVTFPEPRPQRHCPGAFFGDVSSATFLPLWRELLDV